MNPADAGSVSCHGSSSAGGVAATLARKRGRPSSSIWLCASTGQSSRAMRSTDSATGPTVRTRGGASCAPTPRHRRSTTIRRPARAVMETPHTAHVEPNIAIRREPARGGLSGRGRACEWSLQTFQRQRRSHVTHHVTRHGDSSNRLALRSYARPWTTMTRAPLASKLRVTSALWVTRHLATTCLVDPDLASLKSRSRSAPCAKSCANGGLAHAGYSRTARRAWGGYINGSRTRAEKRRPRTPPTRSTRAGRRSAIAPGRETSRVDAGSGHRARPTTSD